MEEHTRKVLKRCNEQFENATHPIYISNNTSSNERRTDIDSLSCEFGRGVRSEGWGERGADLCLVLFQ